MTYRLRWGPAVGSCLTVPVRTVVVWTIPALVIGSWTVVVLGLVVAVATFAWNLRRVRRRTLSVGDDGPAVQHDPDRLISLVDRDWHDGPVGDHLRTAGLA